VTSTRTLVGEDSPAVGTREMLLIDLVRSTGDPGTGGCGGSCLRLELAVDSIDIAILSSIAFLNSVFW
jgi:hypothetical protein